MLEQIKEAAAYLKNEIGSVPETAIILGTGLGELVHELTDLYKIPYKDIPHFPVSTVEGHSGNLFTGYLNGTPILGMQGRFHYYEGYTMKEVTFPIRVMKELGIRTLFISNAAGGMNPDFKVGDVMIITDHINLFPEHPLRGKNHPELGSRFPDMSEAYSGRLINKAFSIAEKNNLNIKNGTYVGVQGPTFETPAEYRFFRIIGGDAVGMSTVPETIVAKHAGLEVFALSVITDLGIAGQIEEVSHEEVQLAAKKAQPTMILMIKELIKDL